MNIYIYEFAGRDVLQCTISDAELKLGVGTFHRRTIHRRTIHRQDNS